MRANNGGSSMVRLKFQVPVAMVTFASRPVLGHFSLSAPAGQTKGADPPHPCSWHREAPLQRERQAAPIGAHPVWPLQLKFAVSEQSLTDLR
jgi:hypothetical protein